MVVFNQQEIDGLQQHLMKLGLLGESLPMNDGQGYRLGERFYQLLTFMGCSPALKLEPAGAEDKRFCHFRFIQKPYTVFRFLRAEARARCPRCRKPGSSAGDILRLFDAHQQDWLCPHCRQASALTDINWKHEAGMGLFFIELLDVHPHEVAPTDSLLKVLETITGRRWRYFYATI